MDDDSMTNCFVVKVCVVGESCVGKSSLALRFTRDEFHDNMLPTLGAGFLNKSITNGNGEFYKFQIWDTAGQERYRSLVPLYYHGAAVVLIVYDVTNRNSFTSGAVHWIRELQKMGPPDALYALVGNKADLEENLREVSAEEGERCAQQIGAFYFETSAKSGHHVFELFSKICKGLEKSSKALPCVPHRPDSICSTTDSEKSSSSWIRDISKKFSNRKKENFKAKSLKFRLIGEDSTESSCCYM